jgi:hypothetical protein
MSAAYIIMLREYGLWYAHHTVDYLYQHAVTYSLWYAHHTVDYLYQNAVRIWPLICPPHCGLFVPECCDNTASDMPITLRTTCTRMLWEYGLRHAHHTVDYLYQNAVRIWPPICPPHCGLLVPECCENIASDMPITLWTTCTRMLW